MLISIYVRVQIEKKQHGAYDSTHIRTPCGGARICVVYEFCPTKNPDCFFLISTLFRGEDCAKL